MWYQEIYSPCLSTATVFSFLLLKLPLWHSGTVLGSATFKRRPLAKVCIYPMFSRFLSGQVSSHNAPALPSEYNIGWIDNISHDFPVSLTQVNLSLSHLKQPIWRALPLYWQKIMCITINIILMSPFALKHCCKLPLDINWIVNDCLSLHCYCAMYWRHPWWTLLFD